MALSTDFYSDLVNHPPSLLFAICPPGVQNLCLESQFRDVHSVRAARKELYLDNIIGDYAVMLEETATR